MCRIKYWINRREPEATSFAKRMREAGIDFSSIPTSGPVTLYIDGRSHYGINAVRYAVGQLIKLKMTRSYGLIPWE
jgi:hypothetical protein